MIRVVSERMSKMIEVRLQIKIGSEAVNKWFGCDARLIALPGSGDTVSMGIGPERWTVTVDHCDLTNGSEWVAVYCRPNHRAYKQPDKFPHICKRFVDAGWREMTSQGYEKESE